MSETSFTLKGSFKSLKDLEQFKLDVRKEIVENGLDGPINSTLGQLQADIKYLINEQIRNIETVLPGQPLDKTNSFDQEKIDIPKVEEELLKFFGYDVSRHNKGAADFSTLEESKILYGAKNKQTGTFDRVTLRMTISENEDIDSHFEKAKAYFNDAVFALPDQTGKISFFLNPGIDLSRFIKIKCSKYRGTHDHNDYGGMSPQKRFELDKQRKGSYSEWTIKQKEIDDTVRDKFIPLNDILDLTKEGKVAEARELVRFENIGGKLNHIDEKLEQIEKKDKTTPTIEAHTNMMSLVNNLKVAKRITKDEVLYSLVSNYNDLTDVNFIDEIKKIISFWKITNDNYWFKALTKKAEDLLKRYK